MIDFLKIATRSSKKDVVEIYPKFIIKKSSDLMIRGGDFYAIWIEERGLWSTDEQDALYLIDKELQNYYKENKNRFDGSVRVMYMWDSDTGMIDKWHKYCQRQMRDNYEMLDEKLIFSNTETNKNDYATKKLDYPLEEGNIEAYDQIMSVLYSQEERKKLEWAIGSIITGDSKTLQKFIVLYGGPGTGKSTILNIIQQLFEGYYSVFDAKALGSANATFALEAFKSNPLIAIQHDGDLSKIEDNTRLNSLVSHEYMTVNEKFKSTYPMRFKSFLFMGTNKPVKITDAKSGILRRLIDVSPTGNKLSIKEYNRLVGQIKFELGAIAFHCQNVYLENKHLYDNYIPVNMMGASNDFYNFILDNYYIFKEEDGVSLKQAWEMYKNYCDDAKVPYPFSRRIFKEELKSYFWEFKERYVKDSVKLGNYYLRFRTDKFEEKKEEPSNENSSSWLSFNQAKSIFDEEFADCPAQYATDEGKPMKAWDNVKTKLSDLDTTRLHYVKFPDICHIVIDFDIPDESGNKCLKKNIEAANEFPATYAELSKSGEGIHLHYFYSGDVSALSRIFKEHIEVKIFNGGSSLRRKLTKCNSLPIAKINSGLPLNERRKNMINFEGVKSEKHLRSLIKGNLNKEYHGYTKPSIDFIHKILEEAYKSGLKYDVTDMRNAVLAFAACSNNNADYCIKLINKTHFKSDDASENVESEFEELIFYDIEVFPNLFLVNWKVEGEGKKIVRMFNPKPVDIEDLLKYRLVGFNNRAYDNHMLYACLMGYSNEQLYNLSTRLISKDRSISSKAKFGEAFNISYTDVYDFAAKKQSLKKWEIELGIHHQELGLPWDRPVPEELWEKVAEYCDYDVLATEAVFHHLKADFVAREILADLADSTVNNTTNSLTTKIIFGSNRHPQDQFNYRDLGEVSNEDTIPEGFDEYTRFNKKHQPVFPGYEFDKYKRKSTYRNEEVSEGGYVYAEQGMYGNVALLDIASMHPHSAIAEMLFGKFTKIFKEIVDGRVGIKHENWKFVNTLLNGKLTKYIQKVINGELTAKDLAYALKIAINSVYGLTSATFDNPFRDPRNIDNIVAKRGALFMVNLKHEVQKRGFTVAHIKTDSIKIPDATPEIIKFVMDYGKMYGYTFEHEATYDRMCLVNDAVYIAKYSEADVCKKLYGYIPEDNAKKGGKWTATGTQFAVPYVFKTLFSKEEIMFDDLCETKSVKEGTMYLDMNEGLQDVSFEEKELKKYESLLKKEDFSKYKKEDLENSVQTLKDIIAENHKYLFVGRVGQFCPIKAGDNGGGLYRYKDGKYYAVTGTKGYRWLESEVVKNQKSIDDIDRSYYDRLATDAANDISKYGDFEWFVSDDPYIGPPYNEKGQPIYLDIGGEPTNYTNQTLPAF